MRCSGLAAALFVALPALAAAGDWPAFRGPAANGLAADAGKLPEKVGPEAAAWSADIPAGISSPVVVGGRVYVTGTRDKELVTQCRAVKDGSLVWEAKEAAKQLEKIHSIGSQAQSTPAADADGVVVFFGSAGLFAYDNEGKRVWDKPYGPFKNDFGAGSSPVIVDGKVILNQDHDEGSFLACFDRKTGKPLWTADRSEFPRGYATPLVIDAEGGKQVLVVGTLRAVAYDLATGKEAWTVRGLSRIVNMSPAAGPDGTLYLPAWSPGGDEGSRIEIPPFDEAMKKADTDKNGTLEDAEIQADPALEGIKTRFTQIDRDKSGHITKAEYEEMRRIFNESKNRMIAVKPGAKSGDVTASHVAWEQKKSLPYVPSPLIVGEHLFLVRNGGLLTTFDTKTGRPVKDERLPRAGDQYFASPVSGDGKVYLLNEKGRLTVVSAEASWKVLHSADFGEQALATPALADGRVFVRTNKHLFCVGPVP